MELEFELTRDDFEKFNRYYFLNKGLKKRLPIIIAIIFGIPLLIELKSINISVYLRSVALYTVIFIPILTLVYFYSFKSTKNLPEKDGSLLGKKKFIFNEKGIIEETKYNRNEYSWKGVKSIESNNEYIFIFVDTIAAYIIPKRYFKNEKEETEFLNFISNNYHNAP